MDGLLVISLSDLVAACRDYIIDSKAGDTLSYRETAALDVEVAAESSADTLWAKLKHVGAAASFVASEVQPDPQGPFKCAEDLGVGQFVMIVDGQVVAATQEQLNEKLLVENELGGHPHDEAAGMLDSNTTPADVIVEDPEPVDNNKFF